MVVASPRGGHPRRQTVATSRPIPSRSSPPLWFWAPAALLLLASIAAATLALTPVPSFQRQLVLIDHDDSRTPVTAPQVQILRQIFAVAAALAACLALVLLVFRRRVGAALGRLALDARAVARESLATPAPSPPIPWRLFGFLFAVGVLLRLTALEAPMRFDEADTFNFFASRDFFNTLTDYTAPNNHIFHSLLVRLSYLTFGDSPTAIRLPALAAGVAILPLTFWLGRRLFSSTIGLAAMGLAAVHPALISFSANARGYTLVTAFTLVLFLLAATLASRRSAAAWLLFIGVGVVGMCTIPTMLYSLAAVSVWALVSAPIGRRLRLAGETAAAAAVIASASAVLYAPAAMRTGLSAVVANRYVVPLDRPLLEARLLERVTQLWDLWTQHIPLPLALLLVAFALYALTEPRGRRLLFSLVLTTAALMAVQRVAPYARVFLYAAPPACLLAGAGLYAAYRGLGVRRPPFPVAATALTAVLAAGILIGRTWFPPAYEARFREAHALAERLAPELGPKTAVLATIPQSEMIRYTLVTQGLPRTQVLAPNVVSGALPPLDAWDSIILVQPAAAPDSRAAPPLRRISRDHPALARFTQRTAYENLEHLQALRLSVAPLEE